MLVARNGCYGPIIGTHIAGSTAVATSYDDLINTGLFGLYVFRRPRRGWSGAVPPSRHLAIAGYDGEFLGMATGDGTTAATLAAPETDAHNCPCTGSVYVLDPSAQRGGASTLLPSTTLSGSAWAFPPAVDGRTVIVGVSGQIRVYSADQPRLKDASLSGLATGHPRLRFSATESNELPPLQRLSVELPRGLSFRSAHGWIGGAVPISTQQGARLLTRQKLLLTFQHPRGAVSVSLDSPLLTESQTLTRQLATITKTNRERRRKQSLALRLTVRTTDTTGSATALPVIATTT